MKKQTAVDWLNSEFERMSNQIGVNLSWSIMDDLIKQAKEMERNQIIDAVNQHDEKTVKSCNAIFKRIKPSMGSLFAYTGEDGEKYYNEKYGNGKN